MSRYRLVGAAAALAVMTAPAIAQQVISEPGYCAFFYPNANCQNKGPGNPYTDPQRFNQGYPQDYALPDSGQTVGIARKRTHRSTTRMQ
ncbi:hypothetical protein V1294_004105 [Bradyrhizobium sp. AZCC 1678]|uniref:hypothetical protein n=1 Tax=Bradyrhizobium sp. AZCC 1678 TaxID=3117030 RepID=UPI002FF12422